jgi:hypothetical protein
MYDWVHGARGESLLGVLPTPWGTISFLEALSKDRRVILQPCMSCLSGCEPKLQLDGSGNGGVLAVVTSLKVLHLGLLTVVHLCCL